MLYIIKIILLCLFVGITASARELQGTFAIGGPNLYKAGYMPGLSDPGILNTSEFKFIPSPSSLNIEYYINNRSGISLEVFLPLGTSFGGYTCERSPDYFTPAWPYNGTYYVLAHSLWQITGSGPMIRYTHYINNEERKSLPWISIGMGNWELQYHNYTHYESYDADNDALIRIEGDSYFSSPPKCNTTAYNIRVGYDFHIYDFMDISFCLDYLNGEAKFYYVTAPTYSTVLEAKFAMSHISVGVGIKIRIDFDRKSKKIIFT